MKTEFVTKAAFEIEKNAKNTAYAFILASGLLDEYTAFAREVEASSVDAMEFCRAMAQGLM